MSTHATASCVLRPLNAPLVQIPTPREARAITTAADIVLLGLLLAVCIELKQHSSLPKTRSSENERWRWMGGTEWESWVRLWVEE